MPRGRDSTVSMEGTQRQPFPRRLCFIPYSTIPREENEKPSSLTIIIHQDQPYSSSVKVIIQMLLSWKRWGRGGSVLLLDKQNWSHAKTNNKQKRLSWYLYNNKRVKQHRRKAMKEAEDKQISENHENIDNIVQLPKKWNKEPKRTIWWEKKAGRAKEETDKKLKV